MKKNAILGTGTVGRTYASKFIALDYDVMIGNRNVSNILDLGDISTARGTEMYLTLWLRIFGAKNNGAFNIKIVF